MWENLRVKLLRHGVDVTVVEGELDLGAHGAADQRTIHRGAVATIADCALASAVAAGSTGAATVDLRVEFFRPAMPGSIVATARVTNRVAHLVFCEATVEQEGEAVAHASGTIAVGH